MRDLHTYIITKKSANDKKYPRLPVLAKVPLYMDNRTYNTKEIP